MSITFSFRLSTFWLRPQAALGEYHMVMQRQLGLWGMVARGVFLSLILNGPCIWEHLNSSGKSPAIFSDWDEPYYLPLALEVGKLSVEKFFSLESRLFIDSKHSKEDLTPSPHNGTDFMIGKIGHMLDIQSTSLGLLLDLLLFPLSYCLFTLTFCLVSKNQLIAETSSLCLLCFPWSVASGLNFIHVPLSWNKIASSTVGTFPSLPIFRGVYTQVSYPFCGLIFYGTLKICQKKEVSHWWSAWLGGLSGFLIYIYFFAWGAMSTIVVISMTICFGVSYLEGERRALVWLVKNFLVFFLVHLFVAFFGFLLALRTQDSLQVNSSLFQLYYFSLETFGLWCFCVFLFCRSPRHSSYRNILIAVLAIITSQFIVMNWQPFLNTFLGPYHFSTFYLQPLLTGCFVMLLLNRNFPKCIERLTYVLLVVILSVASYVQFLSLQEKSSWKSDFLELINFLETQTSSQASLAVIPYLPPFPSVGSQKQDIRLVPLWIRALTNRNLSYSVFPQYLKSFSPELVAHSELMLGWLYSAKVQLMASCPASDYLSADEIFNGAGFLFASWRKKVCEISQPFLNMASLCNLLQKVSVDYIIWEEGFGLPKPSSYQAFALSVWKSSEGQFEVLQISHDRLEGYVCQQNLVL